MITTALLIIGAILLTFTLVFLVHSLVHAPEAVEDETGFHYVRNKSAVRSRFRAAGSAAARAAKPPKPFKTHIPAA